jgi:exonuclease III
MVSSLGICHLLAILLLLTSALSNDSQCPITQSKGSDRRTHPDKLSLMQYNVEWAFIDYYKNADCPVNGCTWNTTEQSISHLNYVSTIINKYNPDIVNICEIEGCDELGVLVNSTSSNYHPYLMFGSDTATGQNVGLMTKIDPTSDLMFNSSRAAYPIPGSQCGYYVDGDDLETTGLSKHFVTTFDWGDYKIAYISIHLIAYPTDPSRCAKREAQAAIIQGMIQHYVEAGYEIVVIGDFNDYDADILDLNGSVPTSKVLDIIKGKFGVGSSSSGYTLYNVNEMVDVFERYSNWWDKNDNCVSSSDEFVLIDHILISPLLYEKIHDVRIFHDYDIFCGSLNSDHYPLFVEFYF